MTAEMPDTTQVWDAGRVPQVGVIYNPRSHRNQGQDLASDPVPHVFVSQPGDRGQLPKALERFRQRGIDLLVINGGDGTVRDVLTAGLPIFGEDWPAVAVLPKGKTNALAVDLHASSDWSLQGAINDFVAGRRIERRPLTVTALGQGASAKPDDVAHAALADEPLLGFILGAGAMTLGTRAGQSAHKLGAFNGLAVAVTAGWGVAQALFGTRSNEWRRGIELDIRLDPDGQKLPHSGLGDHNRRILLLSSTLERFPAGIKPFGDHVEGLKLAVLDQISRRTTATLPAVVAGWKRSDMAGRGFHQLTAPGFAMTLSDEFILDGEAFPAGSYHIGLGPKLQFVASP